MADIASHRELLAENDRIAEQDSVLVSPDMPLRANLSVLDNIALIPQYRSNLKYSMAADQAWALLVETGFQDMYAKRDPALSYSERFVAKLLRGVISKPAILMVDRPGMLLPEVHYPPFLFSILERMAAYLNDCWIIDYQWNRALYGVQISYPELDYPELPQTQP